MAIRGFSIDITDKVNSNQAITFAQWIGASNVMRNQKLTEYKSLLAAQKGLLGSPGTKGAAANVAFVSQKKCLYWSR